MKVLIVLPCLLAAALAGFPQQQLQHGGFQQGGYQQAGYQHGGAQAYHLRPAPLDRDGRVLETPEILAEKARHFEAYAAQLARVAPRGGYGQGGYEHRGYEPEEKYEQGGYVDAGHGGYEQRGGYEAGNFGGHGAFEGYQGGHQPEYQQQVQQGGHYGGYRGPLHIPNIVHGVPVEPPAVANARQEHLKALSEANARAYPSQGHGYYRN